MRITKIEDMGHTVIFVTEAADGEEYRVKYSRYAWTPTKRVDGKDVAIEGDERERLIAGFPKKEALRTAWARLEEKGYSRDHIEGILDPNGLSRRRRDEHYKEVLGDDPDEATINAVLDAVLAGEEQLRREHGGAEYEGDTPDRDE